MRLGDPRLVIGRRACAVALVLCLLAAPTSIPAQRAAPMPRIAAVFPGSPDCPITPPRAAFLQALSELGFVPGTSLVVDWHCYTSIGEAAGLMAEALRMKPDLS
jgi:hypothetical protein